MQHLEEAQPRARQQGDPRMPTQLPLPPLPPLLPLKVSSRAAAPKLTMVLVSELLLWWSPLNSRGGGHLTQRGQRLWAQVQR